jgi:hypothetical protein
MCFYFKLMRKERRGGKMDTDLGVTISEQSRVFTCLLLRDTKWAGARQTGPTIALHHLEVQTVSLA